MTDYREVLQIPKVAFKSPDLQSANVKQTPLGLPYLVSGGFALTACLTTLTNGKSVKWAIRCFHKEVPDLQERYRHISDFLQKQADSFFVKFQYEPQGIMVRGTWYPIVKMAWVEGDSLNEYIEDNLNNTIRLRNLAEQVNLISKRLNELKIGHGDLQHGNILVQSNGNPILIDYDGMYVPDMPYKNSNEIGHINFQHPARNGLFFNNKIDHFSTIVLYVSLLCLASSPSLWQKYHTGENLIFSRKDYQDPTNSALFSEIKNIPQVSAIVSRFQQLCLYSIEDVPSLDQFINNSISLPQSLVAVPLSIASVPTNGTTIIQGQFKVFASDNIQEIVKQDGEKITVIGKVVTARSHGSMFFINFGNPWDDLGKYKPFTVVIFSQGIAKFSKVKKWDISRLEALKEKYVEITGLLGLYPKNGYLTPQIILEDPYQLKEITAAQASQMLIPPLTPKQASKPIPPSTTTRPTGSSSSSVNPLPSKPLPPTVISGSQTTSSSGSPSVPPKPLPPKPVPPPQPQVVRPSSSTTRGSTTPSQTTYPVGSSSSSSSPTSSTASSSSSSSQSSSNSSNDCFIATATFGTPYAEEVVKYRRFRDEYLVNNILGATFIRYYYDFGPIFAKIIKSNPNLKKVMAKVLGKIATLLPVKEEY